MKIKIIHCNFCNEVKHQLIFRAKDYITNDQFNLYRCTRCKLVQTRPRLAKSLLTSHYYNNYRKADGRRFPKFIEQLLNIGYLLKVKRLLKLFDQASILDVGCGRGLELKILKQNGWRVLGTEMSDDLLSLLSKQKIPAIKSDIWEITGKERFDVITFSHSLEHFHYPDRALQASARLVKKGGYLIIAVPNFDSFENSFFQRNWFHLDVPRHLFHFPKSTLVRYIDKLGFKLQNCKDFSLEYDIYSFIQSGLNALVPKSNNTLYRFLLSERLSKYEKLGLLFQLPFAFFLFLLSLVLVPIFSFLDHGGTMVLTFKRV